MRERMRLRVDGRGTAKRPSMRRKQRIVAVHVTCSALEANMVRALEG